MAAATSTLCQKCSLVLTNFNTFLLFFNFCFKGLRSNRCCDAAFLRSNRCCDAAILRSNRCCGAAFLRRKCVRLAATLPPVRRRHGRDAPPVRRKRARDVATVPLVRCYKKQRDKCLCRFAEVFTSQPRVSSTLCRVPPCHECNVRL